MRKLEEAPSIQSLAGEVRLVEACLSRAGISDTKRPQERDQGVLVSPQRIGSLIFVNDVLAPIRHLCARS